MKYARNWFINIHRFSKPDVPWTTNKVATVLELLQGRWKQETPYIFAGKRVSRYSIMDSPFKIDKLLVPGEWKMA